MLLDTPYAEWSQEPVVVVKDKEKHEHCSVVIESPDQMCYSGCRALKNSSAKQPKSPYYADELPVTFYPS